jgi:hypothetical protein
MPSGPEAALRAWLQEGRRRSRRDTHQFPPAAPRIGSGFVIGAPRRPGCPLGCSANSVATRAGDTLGALSPDAARAVLCVGLARLANRLVAISGPGWSGVGYFF